MRKLSLAQTYRSSGDIQVLARILPTACDTVFSWMWTGLISKVVNIFTNRLAHHFSSNLWALSMLSIRSFHLELTKNMNGLYVPKSFWIRIRWIGLAACTSRGGNLRCALEKKNSPIYRDHQQPIIWDLWYLSSLIGKWGRRRLIDRKSKDEIAQ